MWRLLTNPWVMLILSIGLAWVVLVGIPTYVYLTFVR
jgi:hypothetical protein